MRDYRVKSSAHGFPFRFDDGPSLTLEEAVAVAKGWILYADTVGGDAVVVRLSTNEQIWPPP